MGPAQSNPNQPIRRSGLLGLGLSMLLLGFSSSCGSGQPIGEQLVLGELAIRPIEWNATPLGPGRVATIAEGDDEVALFGDTGVALWSNGESQGKETAVRSWRAAAVVPALGFAGRWLLGVDSDGRVHRLRFGSTQPLSLEDVSARYLLAGKNVSEVAHLGGALVGFVVDGKLAVSDGKALKQYDLALRGLVGSGGQAAGLGEGEGGGVQWFDAQTDSLRHLELPEAMAVAFDPAGKLWAATSHGLFRENGGQLEQAYSFDSSQQVRALSSASSGLWVLLSDSLALIRDGQLLTAPLPASPVDAPDPGVRLLGSPSGDAWLLGDSQVTRVGEDSGGGQDLVLWRKQMLPVFQRLCQTCHLPSGSAHLDLSTHSSWSRFRHVLGQRVVEGLPTPMPPIGTGKPTAEELAAVSAWVSRR